MKYTYTEYTTPFGEKMIERIDENGVISFIPTDPANSDDQAYLKSLEEGTPKAE